MTRLPLLALLPLFLLPVPAALAQGGAACSGISDDTERLACYDGLFRNSAETGDLAVSANSEQLIPARPSGRAPATITVSCTDGQLDVAFRFAGNTLSALGNDSGITLQLDLQAANSRTLPVDSTNTALLIVGTRDAAAFLDSLAGVNNLTVRVTPASSRSLRVRFRAEALLAAAAPVRAACDA